MAEPKLYDWSVTIGTACNRRMLTFVDLAGRLLPEEVRKDLGAK
jgi:hypothetical protein